MESFSPLSTASVTSWMFTKSKDIGKVFTRLIKLATTHIFGCKLYGFTFFVFHCLQEKKVVIVEKKVLRLALKNGGDLEKH